MQKTRMKQSVKSNTLLIISCLVLMQYHVYRVKMLYNLLLSTTKIHVGEVYITTSDPYP